LVNWQFVLRPGSGPLEEQKSLAAPPYPIPIPKPIPIPIPMAIAILVHIAHCHLEAGTSIEGELAA